MNVIGPFTLHEQINNEERGYELFFDWDESFDDRGLTITQVFESNGEPGAAVCIPMNRAEAQELMKYLYGCLNYRPRFDN